MRDENGVYAMGNSATTITENNTTTSAHASDAPSESQNQIEQQRDSFSKQPHDDKRTEGQSHASPRRNHVEQSTADGKARPLDQVLPRRQESSMSSISILSAAPSASLQSLSPVEAGTDEDESSADKVSSSSFCEQTEKDAPQKKGAIAKKDRSKLRKGKWTVRHAKQTLFFSVLTCLILC